MSKKMKKFNFKNNQTSIIYKIFSYLCLFYIICLPLKAMSKKVSIVKYNIPILVIASIVIIMLSKKRLSYELTIKFKNATLWVLLGTLIVSVFCFELIREKYVFSYSLINFWRNIFVTDSYNNLFFFSYNILIFFILAVLLTFNNTHNIKEYYNKQREKDYSALYTNAGFILIIFIAGLAFFKELNQITENIFYFIGITYLSALVGISVSRILINIWDAINSLLKGKSNE